MTSTFVKLIALITLVTSTSLFAGTSEQDYRVWKLREDFKKAHIPLLSELHEKKTWLCSQTIAQRDLYQIYDLDPIYYFVIQGPKISHGDSFSYQVHSIKSYNFGPQGLLGISVYPEDVRFNYMFGRAIDLKLRHKEVIRITQTGDLIAELVFDEAPQNSSQFDGSVSFPEKKAHLYTYCSKFFVE